MTFLLRTEKEAEKGLALLYAFIKGMNVYKMDIQLYLERINYSKTPQPNQDTLFELQQCHLNTVPFENLDIHYGRLITLDMEAFFQKIVLEKRGGFCYELNGLFYCLLKRIGFDVKMISARVYVEQNTYGKEYDHLAILATIDDQVYLVDVGFGSFAEYPLLLKEGIPIVDPAGLFQFDVYKGEYWRINEIKKGEKQPLYIFKTLCRALTEFEEMAHFHQFDAASHFTTKKVVSMLKGKNRMTLNNHLFKITTPDEVKEWRVENEAVFAERLQRHFNITIKKYKG